MYYSPIRNASRFSSTISLVLLLPLLFVPAPCFSSPGNAHANSSALTKTATRTLAATPTQTKTPTQTETPTQSEKPTQGEALNQAQGRAALKLEPRPNGGYFVRFNDGPFRFISPAVLVSIDKKNLKDLSDKQIKDLLAGPIDSSVEIEVLTDDGKIKNTSVARIAATKKPLWERRDINAENYDRRSDQNWNGAFVEDSLDIEARASQNLVMRAAQEWPEPITQQISMAAFSAALTNYEVGNLDDGDYYLALSEKTYEPGKNWRLNPNRQAGKSIETLVSVGKLQDAKKMLDMLVEGGGLQPFSLDDGFKALATAQIKQDKAAAFATLNKLAAMNKGPNQARLWVAEIYQQGGELKKAGEIYSKLNLPMPANQIDKRWGALQSSGANALRSAFLQNDQGDKSAASASLQQAIDGLKTNLISEQVACIERMPGVFPKLSDLQSALTATQTGKPFPRIPAPPNAVSFPDIRACHEAIKGNDKATAIRLTKCPKDFIGINV
jgi:tetratricopeptide (TPR) repeat protein